MDFLNKTYAVTFDENGHWLFAKSAASVISGNGGESLIALIKSQTKSKKRKIVVWNFHLSEMVIWSKLNFSHVEQHSMRSFIVKFANFENIEFRNAKEFYRSDIKKIAEKKNLSFKNELAIIWYAMELERLANGGKIHRIPVTAIGYVSRTITTLDGFNKNGMDLYRLGKSITPETHSVISDCKNGGLCGVDWGRIDYPCVVNSYDFKSFYPWIMSTQIFPAGRYICVHGLTENSFRFQRFNTKAQNGEMLWIARARFKYIRPKGVDWLGFNGNGQTIYTFTNLDYLILQADYEFLIEEFTEFIPFELCKKLPQVLRDYIGKQFQIKESFKKGSQEYENAKIFLNSIFGLFCQNQERYGKSIDCFTARQRPMVIGVFVTAYGRFFLWDIAHKHNPLIWDTDGFKTEDTLDLELFNQSRETIGRMGKLLCEAEYAQCTVFGNKQYCIDGVLKLSGTDGKLATEYCRKNNIIPKVGTVIPPEFTNKIVVKDNKMIKVPYTIGSKFYEENKDGINFEC